MKQYETLEHPSDIKIRAFGKTKEELFSNMICGMFEVIKPKIKKNKSEVERKIKIKATDQESLLVDFLNEALYQSDVHNETYFKAKFEKLTNTELGGKIFGQPIESFALEIKAVTYHGLEVKKVDDYWEAVALFDI